MNYLLPLSLLLAVSPAGAQAPAGDAKTGKTDFKHETVYYPGAWKCHECKKGEELGLAIVHYNWDILAGDKPRDFPWAYFQVDKLEGSCSPIDSPDFLFIKDIRISGRPARLYEVRSGKVPVDALGQAQPQLLEDKKIYAEMAANGACYRFSMIAHKRHFDRFWKDFWLILQRFKIKKGA